MRLTRQGGVDGSDVPTLRRPQEVHGHAALGLIVDVVQATADEHVNGEDVRPASPKSPRQVPVARRTGKQDQCDDGGHTVTHERSQSLNVARSGIHDPRHSRRGEQPGTHRSKAGRERKVTSNVAARKHGRAAGARSGSRPTSSGTGGRRP